MTSPTQEATPQIAAATAIAIPTLNEGEIYAGGVITKEGNAYQLILLPGDRDDADWNLQMAWAKEQGGDLPDRVEQALLYKYMPERFQKVAYWSNTPHATNSGYAWCQFFLNGIQDVNRKGAALRAVAVRRLPI